MKLKLLMIILIILISFPKNIYCQNNFYAYHTKLSHSSTDYLGKYADLIVVVGEKGRLEFTRQTQYLPRWVTENGTFLVDDFFPDRDFDADFEYNYIRVMKRVRKKSLYNGGISPI